MRKIALLVLLLCALPAMAQTEAPKVHASLIPETRGVAPGGTVTVALEEKIAPGWHTYWVNPGDAGQPSDIQWTLPPGWKAGAIAWPTPKRLPVASLMDYGYEGSPWLLIDVTAPTDAKPGDSITLKGHASWLVCKNVCIPEDQQVALTLKIGAPGARDPRFATARALLPTSSPWLIQYALGNTLDLFVAAPALAAAHPTQVDFFPLISGTIKDAAPQQLGFAKNGLVLRMQPGKSMTSRGGALEGVLVLTSSDNSIQAIIVKAYPGPIPAANFSARGGIGLLLAMVFAFLGGLILNVMPCVLPILAMKALALTRHGGDHGKAAREGFSYCAGAILSFVAFGVAIIVLRAGGTAIGWGFQLQEPIAVAFFALLIFAVGLNLSGVFEFSSVTAGDTLARRGGVVGAFFTGILAVAVAAPCTAPFMAVALGFALTQTAFAALAIFLALGVGFAAPFLLLALWPAALRAMPKPGPWMLRLKQFLAFPMYAAAAWLVWVLALEAGGNAVAIILAAMIALALAAWLWSSTRGVGPRGRGIGALAALLVLLATLFLLMGLRGSQAPLAVSSQRSDAYTPARLASLRAAKTPVFVDATAAWCITCLVNEQAVLSKPDVQAAFRAHHVVTLVADWTNRNAAITALLQAQGRSGVPLYLYYAPGANSPVLLPQILTQDAVLAALTNANG